MPPLSRPLLRLVLALAAIASASHAQVGIRDVDLVNKTGVGSPTIPTTFVYPSDYIGRDAPLRQSAEPWPAIVVLHGFGRVGAEYHVLAADLAALGFVIALPNTGRISIGVLENDAIAMLAILRDATLDSKSFLHEGIDVMRTGLLGHSYGGSACARVLGRNLGYRAGLAIAPVYTDDKVKSARLPFAVIHGEGDTIVPSRDGSTLYRAATSYRDLKFYAALDRRAMHMNVAGMLLFEQSDHDVWALSSQMISSFFNSFLNGDATAIRGALGTNARANSLLRRIDLEVDSPMLWHEGKTTLGARFSTVVSAEPGPFVLYVGLEKARIATPFGILAVDPQSIVPAFIGRMGFEKTRLVGVQIPNDPNLVGKSFLMQGLATRARTGLRLSAVDRVDITN